jgi:hypothetical protein
VDKFRSRLSRLALLGALSASLVGVSVALSAPASAAPVPVASLCNSGWYVNGDEVALLPEQKPGGFLFDGPSLVHRALAVPVSLATAPLNGAFTATVEVGVAPLFKMETTAPYSTINKTGAGKYWSSKIASGAGSQSAPVDTLAALGALAPYTADSKVYSFGVGYANDTGNRALVKTITFGGSTFDLACVPAPSSSAASSAPPSVPPSGSATPVPTATGTDSPDALAITGTPVGLIVILGTVGVAAGVALYFFARRRRTQFIA